MKNSKISTLVDSTKISYAYASHNVSYATFVGSKQSEFSIEYSQNAMQCGVCVELGVYILRIISNSTLQAPLGGGKLG